MKRRNDTTFSIPYDVVSRVHHGMAARHRDIDRKGYDMSTPPGPSNVTSPLNQQGLEWSKQARFILGGCLALTFSLLVFHILPPPTWAADSSPSPLGGTMEGSRVGPGIMWGSGMCPMGGPMPNAPFPPSQLPELDSKGAVLFKTYCT